MRWKENWSCCSRFCKEAKTYLDGPIVFFINICLSIVLFILIQTDAILSRVLRTLFTLFIGLILVVLLQKVCLLFLFLHDFFFVRFPHHKLEKIGKTCHDSNLVGEEGKTEEEESFFQQPQPLNICTKDKMNVCLSVTDTESQKGCVAVQHTYFNLSPFLDKSY